jgi:BirA family biotin operon repressor/biotin-[acetyl-CoA-carboxylase] ligase
MANATGQGPWTMHLADEVIRTTLGRTRVLSGLHPVGEVGSTQDVTRELAAGGAASGTVVIADRQVAGRGRSGRTWDDRSDGGTLAMTVLIDVNRVPADTLALVPHALGLAVVAAASALTPGAPTLRLKWPNDVVLREAPDRPARKVSGVLVEWEQVPAADGPRDVLLCGIGIDVDLRGGGEADDRICLATLAGDAPDRALLLAALLGSLDEALHVLIEAPRALMARYRAVSDTIGRGVTVELPGEGHIDGTATEVDDTGRLVVVSEGRARAILSGTVRDRGAPE